MNKPVVKTRTEPADAGRRFKGEPDAWSMGKEVLLDEIKHRNKTGIYLAVLFMGIGIAFFVAAHFSQSTTHPALAFVYTVLGTATFLYGTGTSGVAFLNKEAINGKFFLGVAGGAGVLAAGIFWAFLAHTKQIKKFFEPPLATYQYQVKLYALDGQLSRTQMPFMARLSVDGLSVATQRTDDRLNLVYRTSNALKTEVLVSGSLYFNVGQDEKGRSLFQEVVLKEQPQSLVDAKEMRLDFDIFPDAASTSKIGDLLPDLNQNGVY